jgi:deoxyadenosine/deoxycytidine kinase
MELNNKLESTKTIVSIEGNIGVGKSTFTKILQECIPSSEIVSEPVDMWLNIKNDDNRNILQMFYDDPTRYGYLFQNIAYVTRMMKIERTIRSSTAENIFLDRSIDTDRYVFEKMLYAQNKLETIEHAAYQLWCDFYYEFVRKDIGKKIIYLRCDPETCYSRIKIRGREEEKNITLEYLKELHTAHEEWLMNNPLTLVLDCNKDFEHDIEWKTELINKVKNFLFIS